jgi:uncharacterized protein YlzI (FlbEa/FlbD family)
VIRLTAKVDGGSLYLNPAAIESIGRQTDGEASGSVVRMMNSAIHTVVELPEAIIELLDGQGQVRFQSETRWRLFYGQR